MPIQHSQDDIERGLLVLALTGGNTAEAARTLAALDPPLKVNRSTLSTWRTKHSKRYAEISAERVAELETIVLQQVREAIVQAGILQGKVLGNLIAKVDDGDLDAKDLANVLKSAGVTLGINVEKMLLLTNRPTVIAEKRDVGELIASLAQRVPGLIVADAEEIVDARGIEKGASGEAPVSDL
jgi:hypothetical protein